MSVSPIGTNQQSNAASNNSSKTVDYNAFLQLLIAQMKNQDPTAPMDSTQYMAQLASFSQVEQSVSTNSKLDSLLTASALQNADAAIGHNITSADGTVTGEVASVKIYSDGAIATLKDGQQVLLGPGVTIS
ncbi:flagellar hook assembly protein FlgD [Aquabacter sp. CN5-332]|uniref:flagellar hook assembly protein FlgD n=1 Tax=Aquabacter sp. CN5-332 TaxID=3156608 RepID=UPI0032B585C4